MLSLYQVRGLSDARIAQLNKAAIYTPLDLLMLFPARYFDRREIIDWANIEDGQTVLFEGAATAKPSFFRARKNLTITKATYLTTDGKSVKCSWFNMNFMYRQILPNEKKLVCGRVKRYKSSIEIVSPQLFTLRDENVQPIYKLPKGIPQQVIADACRKLLEFVKIDSYISGEIAKKFGLMPTIDALKSIHIPKDIDSAKLALKSISLEKLAYTLAVYSLSKIDGQVRRTNIYANNLNKISEAINLLPYKLTDDQAAAVTEILSEMQSDRRMNLLLQGDVGSGKTIVAFLCAYFAALSGYQCAIMVPTDILAKQHYVNAIDFFENHGMRVCYVSGGMTKAARETAEFNIANGVVQIIVGTHAVISRNIKFKNLALTIVDEQHRFGVCQRGSLENKAASADNLVMSATPIPRTLALSLYGELKQIKLQSRPSGSGNIKTAVVPQEKLSGMYGYIRSKAIMGEKTFIVCPRVTGDDEISATAMYKELSSGALSGIGIGLVHGQMREKERNIVMNDFISGKIQVLVSTTVIEVGVDVKDATTMVIFGADRFGLSQLHQLRGRVGRSGKESYCFIAQVNTASSTDRLKQFCECDDGFKLAEYDFNERGAGDFLGTRQHGGDDSVYGVRIDAEMISAAKEISAALISTGQITSRADNTTSDHEFIRSLTLS